VSGTALGVLLGLVFGSGLWIAVRAAPPMRKLTIAERIAPYVSAAPAQSRLLARPDPSAAPFVVIRRMLGPLLADAVITLDRVVGGSASIRRRLAGMGSEQTVEEFRLEQLVWGVVGVAAGGGLVAVLSLSHGGLDIPMLLISVLAGAIAGILGRDWWLRRALTQRERTIVAEFPVIADLLALAVVAGEAPISALARVCRLTRGELTTDLRSALGRVSSGVPVTNALNDLADRTTVEPITRFLQGFAVALERGTPLADVLRAQAMDAREVSKRALLEAGGKKEIAMLVPVVFIIMPVTILFALYPGLVTIVSFTN
jgi:tight adherence protein C